MLHLTAEYYIERVYMQCVDIDIQREAVMEHDHLKTNICFMNDGVDVFDHHKVFQSPLCGRVPFVIQYHELLHGYYAMIVIMAFSLAGVHTVCG
jgi:hypothetical protein